MDAIRVPKVENVVFTKSGQSSHGTLHLTAHHLIFHYDDAEKEETWIPYPLIALLTRLPQTLEGLSPLSVRCRTFELFTLAFDADTSAVAVFDSVRDLTVTMSPTQLYAFYYNPNPPLQANDGWSIYSPRVEFGRMGVGTRSKAWRFTDINKDYSLSPTYPGRLVVPTKISDATLQYASKYRSKARIPALTYLHWANFASITRSSQPMVGLTANRSIQDEKLIEAIFQTHHSPDTRVSAGPIYGATTTNLIIDARPTTNALANSAKGAGTENMDHYKEAKKAYLGIDNIHVVRDALAKVVEALARADTIPALSSESDVDGLPAAVLDREALRRSGWLRIMSAIMEGTHLIVRNIHVNSSHVLIHCSDGWDRTAQLSSLAQLCLDPFYRTMKGFAILVEKDWVSFGHRFMDRCGHLSSEKFFITPAEPMGGGGAEAAQAFFASVQNKFTSNSHVKETCPVFHQFLECVRQIQRQFPDRFEFNERFLLRLHHHLYSCQFGTFLANTERERRVSEGSSPPLVDRTISVWDFFNSPPEVELNKNPSYDTSLDDPRRAKPDMGVLFPNPKDVRFWYTLYGRTDEEMNGRIVTSQTQGVEMVGPVDKSADDSVLAVASANGSSAFAAEQPLIVIPGSSNTTPPLPSTSGLSESLHKPSPPTSPLGLRLPTGDRRSPSPSSTRPPQRPAQQDILGAGVKSVWGRLSSGATTAFTAVQGAYDGVAKEFRGLSVSDNTITPLGGGELRSKDELAAWGESSAPYTTSGSRTISSTSELWGSSKGVEESGQLPSMVFDNPWSTVRQPSPPNTNNPLFNSLAADEPETRSILARDPTVAHPITLPQSISRAPSDSMSPWATISPSPATDVSRSSPFRTETDNRSSTPAAKLPEQATDPLGVGPL